MIDVPEEENGFVTRSVEVAVRGSFLLRRPRVGPERSLIVGFHGYAENAEMQGERLAAIPGSEMDWLCSIQALHPFYRMKTGKVVAGWMTRFQRDQAILENKDYIDRVLDDVKDTAPDRMPLVLFGFSQGVAMAYRAASSRRHPPAALIALGGDVPPDLDEGEIRALPPVLVGRGTRDRFYTEEAFRKDLRTLGACEAKVTPCLFEGEHGWNEDFAGRVGEFLAAILVGGGGSGDGSDLSV